MVASFDLRFAAVDGNLSTVYAAGQAPIGWVKAGETFKLETLDCFSGRYKHPDGWNEENQRWIEDNENVLTGPIAVEGAKPGDVLAVHIHDIEITTPAYRVLYRYRPETRTPGDWYSEGYGCGSLPISDNRVEVAKGISVPVRPLIGCIGAAPRPPESIRNIKQGIFGGNMDCPEIGVGTTIFLFSENEGGLLYFGDCKAISAAAELVAPPEVGTILTLSIDVSSRPSSMRSIRFERPDGIFTMASEQNSALAQQTAMREMFSWLEERTGAPRSVIADLLGMVGNVSPCQTMGFLHTAHAGFPRAYLDSLVELGARKITSL